MKTRRRKLNSYGFLKVKKFRAYIFAFLANSPIIMNSCRSKSDCRRGNMDLTMTFRTLTKRRRRRNATKRTTTRTRLEDARKDLFWKTYKSGHGQHIISTMTTMSRASSGIIYIIIYTYLRRNEYYYLSRSGGDYERTRPTNAAVE